MEMYVISFKNIVLSSLRNVRNALGGLYPVTNWSADDRGTGTEAERRAENERQRYNARAVAACWQSTRYLR